MGRQRSGQCSRKTDSDSSGDNNSGNSERPFKKARYVWQLKGKYHLKGALTKRAKEGNDTCEGSSTANKNTNETVVRKSAGIRNNNNNNNICSGQCCMDSLLGHSEWVADNDEESSDEESRPSTADEDYCLGNDDSMSMPVTLVNARPQTHEQFLRKWQARQVAKGHLDNTINKVLENFFVSEPAFDPTELLAALDHDMVGMENAGILMAIHSHGLQPTVNVWGETSNPPPGFLVRPRNPIAYMRDEGVEEYRTPAFSVRPSNPESAIRTENIAESTMDNYQNVHNELLKKESSDCTSSNDSGNENGLENMEMGDHVNFLNAAVSVAIQKKGLTSQNYALN